MLPWALYRTEYFPFYSWDLFSYVPNQINDYGVLINEINGESLENPIYFETATLYFSAADSITAFNLIQQWGHAAVAQDNAKMEDIQKQFENNYLSEQAQIQYQLMKRSYNPIDLYQSRTFISEEPIQSYVYSR